MRLPIDRRPKLRSLHWLAVSVLLASQACSGGGGSSGNNNLNNQTQSVCGNGVREAEEECDDGVANSDIRPDACRSDCRYAHCGDSVVDQDELCDTNPPTDASCVDAGMTGGTLACASDCTYDLSGCFECGDGTLEADKGEECDGAALGVASCMTVFGFQQGMLRCDESCHYDGSECFTCGDGQLDGNEICDDGVNDGSYGSCLQNCFGFGPYCGDGIISHSEICDGPALGGATCTGEGYPGGGSLLCDECLALDTDGCCQDRDGDERGEHCDLGPDDCDDDANNWTTSGCASCSDVDQDGLSGSGCDVVEDCDDNAPGVGLCEASGCPTGYALVASGAFEMGCDSGGLGGDCPADAQPSHPVTLAEFCVTTTEVSVADYRACFDAGVCTEVPRTTGVNPWCNYSLTPSTRETHPVNCISRDGAAEYCALWMNGALPTEAQWEKAARGSDQRKYPWGNSPAATCTRCNWDYSGVGPPVACDNVAGTEGPTTWFVGTITSTLGDSPYGLKDMAGNVSEWVRDCYDDSFYSDCAGGCSEPVKDATDCPMASLRGGNFSSPFPADVTTVARQAADPTEPTSRIGFRCVTTP